jgi:hypothetical protein
MPPSTSGIAEIIRLQMEKKMDNVEMTLTGNKLVITVPDVTKPGQRSSTGKTSLVASTRGAVTVDHPRVKGLKFALNVTVPA